MRARIGPPKSMTIPHPSQFKNKFARFAISWRRGLCTGLGLFCLTGAAHAWVTLDLPDLNTAPPHFGAVAVSHLSDGQFVYGNNAAIYVQNTFGSAGVTSFASVPSVDPSFISVLNDTTAVVGGGQFAPTPIYQFNPSNPSSPGFSTVTSLQNFSAAPASASSLYVVGTNGASGSSSVSYVTVGGVQQSLVDPAGTFSGGVAVDHAGDLFVGDDDTSSIYEFTAAQVQNALNHATTLNFGNGTLLHTFGADVIGSLAVDAQGRVWASGFGADGLFWFNPSNNQSGSLNPEPAGGAYTLSTFSANGSDYVSYVWQSGFSNGSSVVYGYDTVQNVPEPATTALWASLAAGAAAFCKNRRKVKLA